MSAAFEVDLGLRRLNRRLANEGAGAVYIGVKSKAGGQECPPHTVWLTGQILL